MRSLIIGLLATAQLHFGASGASAYSFTAALDPGSVGERVVLHWANWENTQRSYELISRYVMPQFQFRDLARTASMNWTKDNRPAFQGDYTAAIQEEVTDYAAASTENASTENASTEKK